MDWQSRYKSRYIKDSCQLLGKSNKAESKDEKQVYYSLILL